MIDRCEMGDGRGRRDGRGGVGVSLKAQPHWVGKHQLRQAVATTNMLGTNHGY